MADLENVEKIFSALYESLRRLTGLHRQLMDTVRSEREGPDRSDPRRGVEQTQVHRRACPHAEKTGSRTHPFESDCHDPGKESQTGGAASHRP